MRTLILLLFLTFSFLSQSQGQTLPEGILDEANTLVWKGGKGNWDDLSGWKNWDGSQAAQLPDVNTSVYIAGFFDTLNISENAVCKAIVFGREVPGNNATSAVGVFRLKESAVLAAKKGVWLEIQSMPNNVSLRMEADSKFELAVWSREKAPSSRAYAFGSYSFATTSKLIFSGGSYFYMHRTQSVEYPKIEVKGDENGKITKVDLPKYFKVRDFLWRANQPDFVERQSTTVHLRGDSLGGWMATGTLNLYKTGTVWLWGNVDAGRLYGKGSGTSVLAYDGNTEAGEKLIIRKLSSSKLELSEHIGGEIEYNSDEDLNILPGAYSGLTLAGSGKRAFPTGEDVTLSGTLELQDSVFFSVPNGRALRLSGDWMDNRSSFPQNDEGLVLLEGEKDQTVGGNLRVLVDSLRVSKSSGKVRLTQAMSVKGRLTLRSASLVELAMGDSSWSVNGDWYNLGVLVRNASGHESVVEFSGENVGQDIYGTTRLRNIRLNKPKDKILTIRDSLIVTHCFEVKTEENRGGRLNIKGEFVLDGGPVGNAYVATIDNPDNFSFYSGEATVRRYLKDKLQAWYMLGPVTSGWKAGDWNKSFHMSFHSRGSITSFNQFKYGSRFGDEGALASEWWTNITSRTTTVMAGLGYRIYIWNDRQNANKKGFKGKAIVIEEIGRFVFGSHSVSIKRSYGNYPDGVTANTLNYGWNLLSNPYPSPVSWEKLYALQDAGAVQSTAYLWDGANKSYRELVAGGVSVSGDPDQNIIGPGDAFFIFKLKKGTEDFLFEESAKVQRADIPLYRQATAEKLMRLSVSDENEFKDYALGVFDREVGENPLEAFKLFDSGFANIGFWDKGDLVGAYALRTWTFDRDTTLNLVFNSVQDGEFRFELESLPFHSEFAEVFLKDNKLDTLVSLKERAPYLFEKSASDPSYDTLRFELLLKRVELPLLAPSIEKRRILSLDTMKWPVVATQSKMLDAFSFSFSYDTDNWEFVGLRGERASDFLTEIIDGKVTVSSKTEISINENDVLVTGMFRAKKLIEGTDSRTKLHLEGKYELGGRSETFLIKGFGKEVEILEGANVSAIVEGKGNGGINWEWSSTGESIEREIKNDSLRIRLEKGSDLKLEAKTGLVDGSEAGVGDLVLLRRHILGINALGSREKWAGDVNDDGFLSTKDVAEIRNVILGLAESFSMPARVLYKEGDSYSENFNGTVEKDSVIRFELVKSGELFRREDRKEAMPTVELEFSEKNTKNGQYRVALALFGVTEFEALTFGLNWDSDNIKPLKIEASEGVYLNRSETASGRLKVLWQSGYEITRQAGDTLLWLTFESVGEHGGELMVDGGELIGNGLESIGIVPSFMDLFQNLESEIRIENPVGDRLRLWLPRESSGDLGMVLWNAEGSRVFEFSGQKEEGADYFEVSINASPGVYRLKIELSGKRFFRTILKQ
ncbi:hypothetical protein FUAX_25720 [Fulvitalea axinellae]|uniref:Dockerin domain-containing protein n=1 Tax=Fulvitalea axinellae TaxID=1182444 RepID=A0AAU9DCJ5_9BACT|nr:hypothetical protein FUAX_25720 [Fulvitalea axinellae]